MWSGGKDSALALDRATRAGIEVARLLSFYDSATRRVRFHATRVEMLEAQAEAVGIDLRAIPTSWSGMEANLRRELSSLGEDGFAGVVFGDIHLADVRAWYEDRVTAAGLEHVEPIWGEPPHLLLGEFISSGRRARTRRADLGRAARGARGGVRRERQPRRAHVRREGEAGRAMARPRHRRALRERYRDDPGRCVWRER